MCNKKKAIIKMIMRIMLCIYVIALSYFLFFSEHYGRGIESTQYRYNLVLFQEIKRFVKYRKIVGWESFIVNIFGNILAFSPFGFLLPFLGGETKKFLNVALLCLEFTMIIELIQLVFRVGCFDVDDLVMNTLGGIIGFLVYKLAYYICIKRSSRHEISKK